MGEQQLHAVFGTGQVGSALAAHLTGTGDAVRTASRSRMPTTTTGTASSNTAR
jgi:predicted dinucleotide-binding enzyme